mmetsp:Transcript_41779/g.91126  ORF Transcript_41779/g.91126 Transcript_41779/m.91126 type:complete len:235 (+) Transcript_41779:1636-2340(+)
MPPVVLAPGQHSRNVANDLRDTEVRRTPRFITDESPEVAGDHREAIESLIVHPALRGPWGCQDLYHLIRHNTVVVQLILPGRSYLEGQDLRTPNLRVHSNPPSVLIVVATNANPEELRIVPQRAARGWRIARALGLVAGEPVVVIDELEHHLLVVAPLQGVRLHLLESLKNVVRPVVCGAWQLFIALSPQERQHDKHGQHEDNDPLSGLGRKLFADQTFAVVVFSLLVLLEVIV